MVDVLEIMDRYLKNGLYRNKFGGEYYIYEGFTRGRSPSDSSFRFQGIVYSGVRDLGQKVLSLEDLNTFTRIGSAPEKAKVSKSSR